MNNISKILWKEIDYGKGMDKRCVNLCNTLNALPGIETFESCEGHGCSPFRKLQYKPHP